MLQQSSAQRQLTEHDNLLLQEHELATTVKQRIEEIGIRVRKQRGDADRSTGYTKPYPRSWPLRIGPAFPRCGKSFPPATHARPRSSSPGPNPTVDSLPRPFCEGRSSQHPGPRFTKGPHRGWGSWQPTTLGYKSTWHLMWVCFIGETASLGVSVCPPGSLVLFLCGR